MKEYDWFDSVIKTKIALGKYKRGKDSLEEHLDELQHSKGMSSKVGDRLWKKYKNTSKWKNIR